jgi:MSHA biogenesis protein MshN
MSVLNTMLRDLERRGERPAQPLPARSPDWISAATSGTAALPRRHRLALRAALWLAAAAAAAVLTFWLWPRFLHSPAKPNLPTRHVVAAPLPVAEAPATPAAQPLPPPASVVQAAPAESAVQAAAAEPVPQAAPSPARPAMPRPSHRPAPVKASPAPAPQNAETAAEAGPGAAAAAPAVTHSAKQSELTHAIDLIGRGRTTEAAQLLVEALARRPDWEEARTTLAALQAESGDRRLALATLLGGVATDPRRFAPTAAQLQAEDDPAAALHTLEKVPLEARGQAYHALAAAVAQRAGQHQLAVVEYGAALRAAPTDAVTWVGLGVSLQALGRNAESLAAYRGATGEALSADLRSFVESRIRALQTTVAPAAP